MTFAFPVDKTALDSGKLLKWTKEVTDKVSFGGTIGKDVVQLLQRALNNLEGLYITCNALINDVGEL
jgi:hexokinase